MTVGPAGLAIPVAGVKPSELVDTFTQARAGGARVHDAIDIMAPTGTPVVSAAPGHGREAVLLAGRRRDHRLCPLATTASWTYYYAHLSAYAPGPARGAAAAARRAGRLSSASPATPIPAGPHLHFAINRMAPGEKWYQGTPINPYPLLAGKAARR